MLNFGPGGRIIDIVKPSEKGVSSVVAVRNLPLDWNEADLLDILDHLIINNVTLQKNRENPQVRDAII